MTIIKMLVVVLCIFQVSYSHELPRSMAVAGDSISRAFNTGALPFFSAPSHSWATGTDLTDIIPSHYEAIKAALGNETLLKYNFAKVSATSDHFPNQAERIARVNPDYVMIFIGSNDICLQQEIETYEENMRTGIETIINNNPEVKILLLSLPDITKIIDVGEELGCGHLREKLVCKTLNSQLTDDEINVFKEHIEAYNASLANIAYDYPFNIKLSWQISLTEFGPLHITTRDCFHPNHEGQRAIATISWLDGFWPELPLE